MASGPTLTRVSGLIMFFSSVLSAACLGLLGYTFATGDLPFGITPILKDPYIPAEVKVEDNIKALREQARKGESFAVQLYEEMLKERDKFVEEKKKLDEEKKVLSALKESANKIHDRLKNSEEKVRSLLVEVDESELKNIKKLSDVLTNSEVESAAKMVLEMNQNLAARAIFYMQSKKSAELLTAVMNAPGEDNTKKAVNILEQVHKLSKELGQ